MRDSDILFPTPLPTVALKQHVTIGGTDTKEIKSLTNRRNGDSEDDDSSPYCKRLSDQLVSEIYLRERCMSFSNHGRLSKKSFYLDDLQALFDSDELQEDDEEEATTTTSSKSCSGSLIKACKFGGVEIREYPIIPGDSPAGFKGPPLTIDWTPVSTVRIPDIDKYESVRDGHRRTTKELTMPPSQRIEILRNQGFARSEIQKCTKDANLARRQRKETTATLKYQATYEKLESMQRKTLNVLTFGKRNKAQKEFLKKYVPSYGVVPTPVPAQ